MKVSAQEEYGLRCLLTLAAEGPQGFLTIPEIGRRQGLSTSHVAKLLSILRHGGFVKSTRGQAGGYSLAMKADDMVLLDVLACLGGRLYSERFCPRHSGLKDDCVNLKSCNIQPLWWNLQVAVDAVTGKITIADILKGKVVSKNATFYTDRHKKMAVKQP
jgi:Rrf2 family protein